MTPDVLSAGPQELEALLEEAGQPRFRGRQLFRALWREGVADYAAVTVWPKALRTAMAQRAPWGRARCLAEQRSPDGTVKWLLAFPDGARVETVLLPHDYGYSLCVSSQVGCAMGCTFCASGLSGRLRNLTAGEMLEQVRFANTYLAEADPGARVSRVDLMGSGEPLDNYTATVRFLRLAHEPEGLGLSYRHMTVSTSGLAPRIRRLADEGLPVTLAVSLHAADDELRTRLMPVNRAYPLEAVMEAAAYYWRRTRRRVTFEYLLLRGLNDTPAQARQLVALLRPLDGG
ncbi:MAG: 23S rRNA (adenine(2503)-C(2))-methyltransferase RlmN, partial [Firmicutes bacterium]|nr:23S rRNA (adenine(2503)-C(2))-methyltransferase RlmN [Bacillota bacterium]